MANNQEEHPAIRQVVVTGRDILYRISILAEGPKWRYAIETKPRCSGGDPEKEKWIKRRIPSRLYERTEQALVQGIAKVRKLQEQNKVLGGRQ